MQAARGGLAVRRARPRGMAITGLLLAVALAVAGLVVAGHATSGAGPADGGSVSPLLWGENTDLEAGSASSDWFLTGSALRTGLVAAHTQIVRLPVRGPSQTTSGIANWTELQQALQDVKAMGLVPLVILRNPDDPSLAVDDSQVVNYVDSVFGATATVYYEWANETDLVGPDAPTYTTAWNSVVPQLKQLNPNAKFIGPVNYQYDASYLQYFLQHANPLPDAVSWHEYTCPDSQTDDYCLAQIDNWTTHFSEARTLMQNTIGQQLPIWISEWNYSPNLSTTRGATFLQQWTTKALDTLAANGIAASMHFNVQNELPLVNGDGSPAPEGTSFQAEYENLVGGVAPTTTTTTTTATTTPTTTATTTTTPPVTPVRYSFEDGGSDGWGSSGNVTSLTNSTGAGGQDGTHALRVVFHSTGSGDFPSIHVNPSTGPSAGQTLTLWLYLPGNTTTRIDAKLYVQDSGFTWHVAPDQTYPATGSWVELSYPLTGFSGNANQIGLQLNESPAGTDTTVYVDSVNWS